MIDSTKFVHYNDNINSTKIVHFKKGGETMNRTKYLLTADDVKDYLECSRDHAYKVIKKLNLELASMGYEVEAGKVPRKFFAEKFYGFEAS